MSGGEASSRDSWRSFPAQTAAAESVKRRDKLRSDSLRRTVESREASAAEGALLNPGNSRGPKSVTRWRARRRELGNSTSRSRAMIKNSKNWRGGDDAAYHWSKERRRYLAFMGPKNTEKKQNLKPRELRATGFWPLPWILRVSTSGTCGDRTVRHGSLHMSRRLGHRPRIHRSDPVRCRQTEAEISQQRNKVLWSGISHEPWSKVSPVLIGDRRTQKVFRNVVSLNCVTGRLKLRIVWCHRDRE
jgi:hypothetical protein